MAVHVGIIMQSRGRYIIPRYTTLSPLVFHTCPTPGTCSIPHTCSAPRAVSTPRTCLFFTPVCSPQTMKHKNALAFKYLLQVAEAVGDHLQDR